MNERPAVKIANSEILEVSTHQNGEGAIDGRELLIIFDGRTYGLLIGTPKYIRSVQLENAKIDDSGSRQNDNMLPMPSVDVYDEVLERLKLMPSENLAEYLDEVEP